MEMKRLDTEEMVSLAAARLTQLSDILSDPNPYGDIPNELYHLLVWGTCIQTIHYAFPSDLSCNCPPSHFAAHRIRPSVTKSQPYFLSRTLAAMFDEV